MTDDNKPENWTPKYRPDPKQALEGYRLSIRKNTIQECLQMATYQANQEPNLSQRRQAAWRIVNVLQKMLDS